MTTVGFPLPPQSDSESQPDPTSEVDQHVRLIESVITRRSAEEMALKQGDAVKVVIKSPEVMLQKD